MKLVLQYYMVAFNSMETIPLRYIVVEPHEMLGLENDTYMMNDLCGTYSTPNIHYAM